MYIIELMNARVALTTLPGLAVHLAANFAADPQAGKSPEEIMDAAREKPRPFRIDAGHASEMH